MSAPLVAALSARIVATGPIPFDEFMRISLYDVDHGYFATGPLRSVAGGDFLTSPEVSPWFGRIVARFVAGVAGDRRHPVTVVDAGAGSGSLLRPLLATLADLEVPVDAHAVEVSPAARHSLRAIPGLTVHRHMDEVPMAGGRSAVVVANELLDNLPAALAARSGDGWEERHVGLVDGALALVAAHPRPEVVTWADRFAGPVPEGGIVEVQLEASRWVTGVLRRLRRGALVAFDYGDTAAELAPRRAEGTVRTERDHHRGPGPPLGPGATDIPMDVNSTAAAAAAERAHARVGLVSQAEFLERWGLGDEIDRLVSEERELAAGGDPMRRLQVRSEHTDAATLLHPRGLGDFRVLVAHRRV
jgi:SAM-dependent MidA family methyltransferase